MPGVVTAPSVAIACGGTGGHLFPGLAVGEALRESGAEVVLFVSSKEVDREASRAAVGMRVVALEAVGLDSRRPWRFVRGLWRSWRRVREVMGEMQPGAVVSMGGFTGAAPLLAARRLGIPGYLHESNSVPGRANRWFAPWVDTAFTGYEAAARRLRARAVRVTGTPCRPCFRPRDKAACRTALGLEAGRPTLVVTGGSQGAVGLNGLVLDALPGLCERVPGLQVLHLAGARDVERVRTAYRAGNIAGAVQAFLLEMETVLGAADVVVSRAGAASMAELSAVQCAAVLVPLPTATDDHQRRNAQEYVATGAALMVDQERGSASELAGAVAELFRDEARAARMQAAVARWHRPGAAAEIASAVLEGVRLGVAGDAARGGSRAGRGKPCREGAR